MALIISHINFKIEIPNFSQLKEPKWSPEVIVYDIPWKVRISRFDRSDEKWLGVHLYCTKESLSPDCSYAVLYSMKLLPFMENQNAIKRYSLPCVFDKKSSLNGKWIRCNDLFDVNKDYVQNDTIKMDITIKMTDPNDRNKSELVCKNACSSSEVGRSTLHRLIVKNIGNLLAVRSPEYMLRNVPFYFIVFRDELAHLSVELHLGCESPYTKKLSIILLSQQNTVQQVKTEQFHLPIPIISWDNLLKPKNKFIVDNSIAIDIEFTAEGFIQDNRSSQSKSVKMEEKALKCPICFDRLDQKKISSVTCGHMFCTECIEKSLKRRAVCPMCNKSVKLKDVYPVYLPL